MMTTEDSFKAWLQQQIRSTLTAVSPTPPFIIWCDPDRVWRPLLSAAASDGSFELWSDDLHELLLTNRFHSTPRRPRVVWLPVSREDISYFKVFELQATEVQEIALTEALSAYGVEIPKDQLVDLASLLPAHAREWIERPRSAWKELTPGNAKVTLIDDQRILEVLANPSMTFETLKTEDRFAVFARRVTEDFGLPAPEGNDPEGWRIRAVAALLCTEAAVRSPENPPNEPDRIIPMGSKRDRALKLLAQWQKHIDLINYFEDLATRADSLTTLQYWARNLDQMPDALSSPIAERTLFQVEVERLAATETFEELARYLDTHLLVYQRHARGFWSLRARDKVLWEQLAVLGSIASLLYQQLRVHEGWQTTEDAATWFFRAGWQVDQAGEALYTEESQLPGALIRVRLKLRKAYQRHLDAVNRTFSELLSHQGLSSLPLSFAGALIEDIVNKATTKDPVAVLVLDACRYDLGCRLADLLNQGEPSPRAQVTAAIAPTPSITALGMAFCLPGLPAKIRVELPAGRTFWRLTTEGFKGDLTQAGQRREWLKETYKLRDKSVMSVTDLISAGGELINAKTLGRLAFVFGDEFDTDGHEGQLQIKGSEDHLERYGRAIRLLRSGGYSTVAVVTDHGFFHWEPDDDEVVPKPSGEILWSSRRAIAGRNLAHPSAIALGVTASDLECMVPRSVNAFKTYGGLGFFHGGATLQELIVPVVVARWPKKARKIGVVLKPVEQIIRLNQIVELAPEGIQRDLSGNVAENMTSRRVLVKVVSIESGKLIFRSPSHVRIEPGGAALTLELEKVAGVAAPIGSQLEIRVLDADDDELLDRKQVLLKVEVDEWD